MENLFNELVTNAFNLRLINGAVFLSKRDDGYNYLLYSDYSHISNPTPFAPIMKINGGKVISAITKENETDKKFLFLMKPCEIRAAVELKKLNQVDLKNSLLVSYTCGGVFEFKEANSFTEHDKFKEDFVSGNLNPNIREICKTCVNFCGEGADIVFDFFNKEVVGLTETGKEFLTKAGMEFKENLGKNEYRVKIEKQRSENRKKLMKEKKKFFKSEDKIIEYFDKCIGCRACRESCPLCYCRQCYFDSDTFKYYPDSIEKKLDAKHGIRLPMDRIIFHLGRVSHMALSCVNCGMCEDVCPVGIEVSGFFTYMGNNIQQTFDYVPGINREEPLPLLTFKEEEFHEVED